MAAFFILDPLKKFPRILLKSLHRSLEIGLSNLVLESFSGRFRDYFFLIDLFYSFEQFVVNKYSTL